MSAATLPEVIEAERFAYEAGLRRVYGETIVTGTLALEAAHQRRCEQLRHALASRFRWPAIESEPPGRLLVQITQRCTLTCPHCWAFARPDTRCSLTLSDLEAIHLNTASSGTTWSVSGGEPFVLSYFPEVLRRFPIDCVFTNASWGHPAAECEARLHATARALRENPHVPSKGVTFILSFDVFHLQGCRAGLPLADAVARVAAGLWESVPGARVRISHARRSPGDVAYEQVFRELGAAGFRVDQVEPVERNGDIAISYWRVGRPGQAPHALAVDCYPVASVCRAVVSADGEPPVVYSQAGGAGEANQAARRPRHRFTIGADGGVGLYQILHSPPGPYWVGNAITEAWPIIAARTSRDPIAVTLREQGPGALLDTLCRHFGELSARLSQTTQGVQEHLYLALLDPERRLLLNTELLRGLLGRGRVACLDPTLPAQMDKVLDAQGAESRLAALRQLYGLN